MGLSTYHRYYEMLEWFMLQEEQGYRIGEYDEHLPTLGTEILCTSYCTKVGRAHQDIHIH